jgi:GDP-4-dehydro-6-deoxy-D-mannose reductase
MRALVTGACGFVGGYLLKHLVACGDEVLGTVLPEAAGRAFPFPTAALDVTDSVAVFETIYNFKPDTIFHLAGMAFVPEAEENFARALAINVGSVGNVFRACHLLDNKAKVLIVSSADMYGRIRPEELPLTEETPIRPATNYGLSKAMAELVPQRYTQLGQVGAVIARPFNHIGPGQNERFVTSSFARQLALIAAGKAAPLMRVGDLESRRDFSDVRDIVAGYRLAAARGHGLYTFCSGRAVSVRSILEALIDIAGIEVSVETDPSRLRQGETPEVYGSYAKAERELGWRPTIPLQETLRDIYAAWREQV